MTIQVGDLVIVTKVGYSISKKGSVGVVERVRKIELRVVIEAKFFYLPSNEYAAILPEVFSIESTYVRKIEPHELSEEVKRCLANLM